MFFICTLVQLIVATVVQQWLFSLSCCFNLKKCCIIKHLSLWHWQQAETWPDQQSTRGSLNLSHLQICIEKYFFLLSFSVCTLEPKVSLCPVFREIFVCFCVCLYVYSNCVILLCTSEPLNRKEAADLFGHYCYVFKAPQEGDIISIWFSTIKATMLVLFLCLARGGQWKTINSCSLCCISCCSNF